MFRQLQHLRDFLDDESLKFLPGTLSSGNFILLKDSRGGKPRPTMPLCSDCSKTLKETNQVTICETCKENQKEWDKKYPPSEPWHQILHVFSSSGTYIGTIENPEYIPKGND